MSYSPPDTPVERLKEETWMQGAILSCLAYGIELTLFPVCLHYLIRGLRRRGRAAASGENTIYIMYTSSAFVLGTLSIAATAKFLELAYIRNRNFPGGPSAFQDAMRAVPSGKIGNAAFASVNWLAEALMIWRYSMVYTGCGYHMWTLLVLPCSLFLATVALGVLWLLHLSDAHTEYALLHTSKFTTATAFLVETSSLYCAFLLMCFAAFASGSPISRLFVQSLGHVQIVATFLIIFRETQGDGWSRNTVTRIMAPVDVWPDGSEVKMVHISGARETDSSRETRQSCKASGSVSAVEPA
ncbi:hypothetical protein B0H10DRAFT_1981348 [Mycena sp. CBHHK59/15]|nr:hypothetical protein B0H10DRAFT_1981348 [Mycena sp. CBHHK59/15]